MIGRLRLAPLALAGLGLLATGPVRPAAAAPTTFAQLPARPVVVLRADPEVLYRLVALARTSRDRGLQTSLLVAALGARAALGHDLTRAAGYRVAGFDDSRPIVAALGAIDDAAAAAWQAGKRARPPMLGHRVVVPVAERTAAAATVARLIALAPLAQPLTAGGLGAVLGTTDPGRARTQLGKRQVVGVGRLGGAMLLVRVTPRAVILDALQASDGPRWDADARGILAHLDARPTGFAPPSTGAGRALAAPMLGVWIDPARAVETSRLAQLTSLAPETARTLAADLDRACGTARAIATTGPFTDLVVQADADADTLRVHARWGLRGAYRLAPAVLLADDGLLDPGAALGQRGAVLTGAVYLASLAPLRALPRPPGLAGTRWTLWGDAGRCGALAPGTIAAFGWPQLLGQLLDDLAGVDPAADTLVSSARNTAFAADRVGLDRPALRGALETSFAEPARAVLAGLIELVFGHRRVAEIAERAVRLWGRGPVVPYGYRLAADRVAFGAGVGERAARWFVARPRGRVDAGPPVAELHADVRPVVAQLSADTPALRPLLAPLAAIVATAAAELRFAGDTLSASATFAR